MFEAKNFHGLGSMIVLSTSMIMISISIGEVGGPADAVLRTGYSIRSK
jgi:hypothetical protein